MEKTHWKKLTNPDYLGAYALEDGKDLVAQIKSVGQEMVCGPDGRKEECTVAHFMDKNVKPMILNTTNCKAIAKMYDTPFIEEWVGKSISIYIAKVKAFGDVVDALRIRPKAPTTKQFKCSICGCIIQDVNNKGILTTAEAISTLSKEQCGMEACVKCAREILNKRKLAETESEQKEGNE